MSDDMAFVLGVFPDAAALAVPAREEPFRCAHYLVVVPAVIGRGFDEDEAWRDARLSIETGRAMIRFASEEYRPGARPPRDRPTEADPSR